MPSRAGADALPAAEQPMSWPVLAVLMATVFVVALGYGAGLPLLQAYLAQLLGITAPARLAWHVGMLGSVYTLALFLFAPWWGHQSDRRGRVPCLVAGFGAFLAGTAVSALVPDLVAVYAARFVAGAGAAAVVPGAQAYIADHSNAADRSRRFVLVGSAAFFGFLSGPPFAAWFAGPVMRMGLAEMPSMVNWPALAVVALGLPLLLALPLFVRAGQPSDKDEQRQVTLPARRRFVRVSMLMALLASVATGTFEVGFSLFGGQTLGLPSSTMAMMFFTCSLAMLVAQSMLLLPGVRQRIDERWLAATFVASAAALGFAAFVPNAVSLALLVAVVATGIGMIGPVLSYELLERDRSAVGVLLGRQAAAGNLGQALGSFSAGTLFAVQPMAPFWTATAVLVLGAVAALWLWGGAREGDMGLARAQMESPGTDRVPGRPPDLDGLLSREVKASGVRR